MIKNPLYVYSENDVLVPARLNFGEYFLNKIWQFRDKNCFINGATDEPLSYGQLAQQAMNLAISLTSLGVRKGHVVAICSENRNEFFGAVIGTVCTGAVITTLNVGYTKSELKHVMSISKPKYVFCSPYAYKLHEKTFKSLDFVKTIILFGNERPSKALLYNDFVIPSENNKYGLKRNVKYEEFECQEVKGQSDTLLIIYSSGTTGLPKGVMLTHLNVIVSCCLPSSHDPTLRTLTITPWYHVMGLVGNLTAMVTGRSAVYFAKFEMDLYLKTIEKYKISQMTVVPPILVALSKYDIKYDVSSVKIMYSGAAPLQKEVLDTLRVNFPGAQVLQGYGMSELTLAVTRDTHDVAGKAKPGGVGYVVGLSTIKIVDLETRKPVGVNQRGEICVKGPLLMKGYLGKDSKEDFDEEGFFKTGDVGYYDEDKCFFIVDRLKELIKYKGYQVPPAEIEALLLQHEGIKDAGVIGVEHKTAGEVPLAFVVKQPGANITESEIKAFVAERLSNPKHLRGGVRFVDEIPKNPSGKIIRKNLRNLVKKGKSKL